MERTLKELAKFRGLPTYQFERRLDAFILPYLKDFFSNSKKFEKDGPFNFLYPEFPLRKLPFALEGEPESRLADAADYLLYAKGSGIVYLIEFKTDAGSVNEGQFESYYRNCEAGWEKLMRNYFNKSTGASWRTYAEGIKYLKESDGLLGLGNEFDIDPFLEPNKERGIRKYLTESISKMEHTVGNR